MRVNVLVSFDTPMMNDKINLDAKLATFSEHYQPRTVAQLNDHDIMVVKLKGPFIWHKHDETDDFFLVLKGSLDIELPDGTRDLPGTTFRRAGKKQNISDAFDAAGAGASAALVLRRKAVAWSAKLVQAGAGWSGAPRPVSARELLPERALLGDVTAIAALESEVMRPLADAGPALTETLDAYLDSGGAIEACARKLFVHPNTVRYRLKRIADFTGRDPTLTRDAYVLRVAATVGRLGRQPYHPSTPNAASGLVQTGRSGPSGVHRAV